MKAVLVIDMPTRCYDCPLYTSIADEDCLASEYGFCDDRNILKLKEAQDKIRFDEKPTWCPLRPLPSKLVPFGYLDVGNEDGLYEKGYNDCIDEITGADNE